MSEERWIIRNQHNHTTPHPHQHKIHAKDPSYQEMYIDYTDHNSQASCLGSRKVLHQKQERRRPHPLISTTSTTSTISSTATLCCFSRNQTRFRIKRLAPDRVVRFNFKSIPLFFANTSSRSELTVVGFRCLANNGSHNRLMAKGISVSWS
jgi:hypothetical protein